MSHESTAPNWRWLEGGLSHPAVIEMLNEHQHRMAENSPAESRHVLDIKALQQPAITFWSLWNTDALMGCVALKHWDDSMGEIKSMKTSAAFTRRGVGKRVLEYVISVAKDRAYQKLKLETGSMDYFESARRLYRKNGFEFCGPFGDYTEDPNNVFMCLGLT